MKIIVNSILSASIALLFFTGCYKTDTVQVISHPTSADASSTFDAILTNLLVYVTNGSTITTPIDCDSFHVLAGLPEGFSVQSASSMVLSTEGTPFISLQDSTQREAYLMSLIVSSLSQQKQMTRNTAIETSFRGRLISAHDNNGESTIDVNTDSINQWIGYSSLENIHIEAGEKVDTSMQIDSLRALLEILGIELPDTVTDLLNNPLYSSLIDTIGIKIIPVATILKVTANETVNNYDLFYYTKTGTLPSKTESSDLLANADRGDMISVALSIKPTSVRLALSSINNTKISFVANNADRSVLFQFDNDGFNRIKIFSMDGKLISSIDPMFKKQVVWNGKDLHGKKVTSGSYLVKFTNSESTQSGKIQFY